MVPVPWEGGSFAQRLHLILIFRASCKHLRSQDTCTGAWTHNSCKKLVLIKISSGKYEISLVTLIARHADLLTKSVDAPTLRSLLQNDNQENLEYISQGRHWGRMFQICCSACEFFLSWFSFIVRIWKQLLLESNQDDSTIQINV